MRPCFKRQKLNVCIDGLSVPHAKLLICCTTESQCWGHGSVVEEVPCVRRDWALSPVLQEERLCQNVYQALGYECPSFLPVPNAEWMSGFFFFF